MNIELIIISWLLEKLKNEKLISDAASDVVKKRFIQNMSESLASSEPKDEAA